MPHDPQPECHADGPHPQTQPVPQANDSGDPPPLTPTRHTQAPAPHPPAKPHADPCFAPQQHPLSAEGPPQQQQFPNFQKLSTAHIKHPSDSSAANMPETIFLNKSPQNTPKSRDLATLAKNEVKNTLPSPKRTVHNHRSVGPGYQPCRTLWLTPQLDFPPPPTHLTVPLQS